MLTTNLFASFHAYCVRAGIEPSKLVGRFKSDPEARELLIELETGKLAEDEFERRFAVLLDVPPEGLIDGLFSGVHADELVVDAVRRAHRGGIRTALVSNSWGVHRYPALDVRRALRRRRDLRRRGHPQALQTHVRAGGRARRRAARRSASTSMTCPST